MDVALKANLIHELFDAAVDLPADRRMAFLVAVGADSSVRMAVFALLDAHDRAGTFLADPSVTGDRIAAQFGLGTGSRVGDHTILRPLGEGGYGTVYLAQQDAPLARLVAIKVIKAGLDTGQVVARFDREREVLAKMDHPNIARVFDAGVTDRGRPYFVMEWVDGDPITDFCRDHRSDLPDRLLLFLALCEAVQHAHDRGVLHRDLKPANVLVGRSGGEPAPKVIDFGIAKAMSVDDARPDVTALTVGPQILGTPQYMSPEQADPAATLDFRTDVYGLGGVLYELLAAAPPVERSAFASTDAAEVRRVLRDVHPAPASERLLAAARLAPPDRATALSQLARQVRGPLDGIVAKALSKERSRRYPTAAALADDVRRLMAGESVTAQPPRAMPRWPDWVGRLRRQPRGPLAAGIAALVLIASAAIAVGWFRHRSGPAAFGAADALPVRVAYARGETRLGRLDAGVACFTNMGATLGTAIDRVRGLAFTQRAYGQQSAVTVDGPAGEAIDLVLADGRGAGPARDAAQAAGWSRVGVGRFGAGGFGWDCSIFERPASLTPVHLVLPAPGWSGVLVAARRLQVDPPTTIDPPPVPPADARPGLQATYFDDLQLGHPIATQVEAQLDADSPVGTAASAVLQAGQYSVRCTGALDVPIGGAWVGMDAGGGARVVVDGIELFHFDGAGSEYCRSPVPPGRHSVQVEYRHRETDEGRARLVWAVDGGPVAVVPSSALSHVATDAGAAVAAVSADAVVATYSTGQTDIAVLDQNARYYLNRNMSFPHLPEELRGLMFTRRGEGPNTGVTVDVPADTVAYLIIADGSGGAPSRSAAQAVGWTRIGVGRLLGNDSDWGYIFLRRPAGKAVHVVIPGHTANQVVVAAAHITLGVADRPTTPATSPAVARIISARWGGGNNWADVTDRVAELAAAGEPIPATDAGLKADPTPGWKKRLEVTYEVGNHVRTVRANEGNQLFLPVATGSQ